MKKPKRKPTFARSCLGKQRFDTYDQAEFASRRSEAWIRKNGYLRPYQCKFCGGFHYGHQMRN